MLKADIEAQKNLEFRRVKRISEELSAIAELRAYIDPDDPYETIRVSDEDIPDGCEPVSMSDYLDPVYSVRYIIDESFELAGAMVMVACGGPTIWVDSYREEVRLIWGSDTTTYPLSLEAVDAIDEWASDMWEVARCQC